MYSNFFFPSSNKPFTEAIRPALWQEGGREGGYYRSREEWREGKEWSEEEKKHSDFWASNNQAPVVWTRRAVISEGQTRRALHNALQGLTKAANIDTRPVIKAVTETDSRANTFEALAAAYIPWNV